MIKSAIFSLATVGLISAGYLVAPFILGLIPEIPLWIVIGIVWFLIIFILHYAVTYDTRDG